MVEQGTLIGMILGDGYLRENTLSASLVLGHGIKQKDYALFKANLINVPFHFNIYMNKCNGKFYPRASVLTESTLELLQLRHRIYINNLKHITLDLLDDLSPRGLAIWYCDDGCYHNGAINLSTNCFNYDEHLIIQDYFKGLGIKVDIRKTKKYYQTYFDCQNTSLFLNYIYPHCEDFPDCIKYKFGPLWEGNKEYLIKMHEKKVAHALKYARKNKEKIKRYLEGNIDKIKEKRHAYYLIHKEEITKKNKEYRDQNGELVRQRNREYYLSNKSAIYATTRKYALAHPDKVKEYKQRYKQKIKEKGFRK